MSKQDIERLLRVAFQPTYLKVTDDSYKHAGHAGAKEGGHYVVEIESPAFADTKLIDRHRHIYAALTPIKHTIHALTIHAK